MGLLAGGLLWITWVMVAQAQRGQSSWTDAVVMGTLALPTLLYLYSIPLRDLRALFTDAGVCKPGLLSGRTCIGWGEVRHAEFGRHSSGGLMLVLRSERSSVRINLLLFA